MTDASRPNLDEVVLGAFLEDIGKFMQRAAASNDALPAEVRGRASDVLPSYKGRSSHWHALWTDAFFDELERRAVTLPGGLNLARVRDAAVYHHFPGNPIQWISAEADRLSAGMDRKPRDEEAEQADGGRRDGFRRVALRSIFAGIDLGLGRSPRPDFAAACHEVAELSPDALRPREVEGDRQRRAYAELWPGFLDAFVELCRSAPNPALLHEGLLSLSERYTWAIPSSTIDQPDVPLHDHNKSVAAVAACLYRFHEAKDELADEAAIRDRSIAKYHFLTGDLSGIQAALFRLAAQQVKGATRILRARSFQMGATVEAASLACRRALGLPPYCELLAAGGRFLLLVPAVDGLTEKVEAVRRQLDEWLVARYAGDLAVNLALGRPLTGSDLMQGRFREALDDANRAVELAKQQPLTFAATGVLKSDYEVGADGACASCGVRPARYGDDGGRRCAACHDAHRLGSRLPRAEAVVVSDAPLPGGPGRNAVTAELPCGLQLSLLSEGLRGDDRDAWRHILSGYRVAGAAAELPHAQRHFANYVPRLSGEAEELRLYGDLDEEARSVVAGDAKTFAHIAADSREVTSDGRLVGRPMLAVLKADVDLLGQVFSRGLGEDLSLGRLATLSRMTDAFFTVVLPDLIRSRYPSTYTVYAGGDDLLLLGPWHETVKLAAEVREAFRKHVAGNPDLTLSAGIEFCDAHEPLNRVVGRAERRLEAAKDAGRNRVSLISAGPIGWPMLKAALEHSATISDWMRAPEGSLPHAFVYRTLGVARERERAEAQDDIRAANWRARWAYAIGRSFDRRRDTDNERLKFFDRLLGSRLVVGRDEDLPPAEVPLVIALYRNR